MKFEQFKSSEMSHKKEESESPSEPTKKGVGEEGFLQRLTEKKRAVMAAAAFGVVTAGAGETLAGSRADELFDELDSVTETTKKTPSVRKDSIEQDEKGKRSLDAFEVLDRVNELVGAYGEAKTDSERDQYATEIAETLIMRDNYKRLSENTIHTFTVTLLSTPINVKYMVMDGIVHGSLTDTSGRILRKVHDFRFSVK